MIIHNFCFSFFMCCKGKCFFINSKQIEEKNHSKQNNCKQSPPLNTHLSFRILYSELFLIKIHFQNIYKLNINSTNIPIMRQLFKEENKETSIEIKEKEKSGKIRLKSNQQNMGMLYHKTSPCYSTKHPDVSHNNTRMFSQQEFKVSK